MCLGKSSRAETPTHGKVMPRVIVGHRDTRYQFPTLHDESVHKDIVPALEYLAIRNQSIEVERTRISRETVFLCSRLNWLRD